MSVIPFNRPVPPKEPTTCSFCKTMVKPLVSSSNGAAICGLCLTQCKERIKEETNATD